MTAEQIKDIVEKQRDFFASGATLSISYRLEALNRLRLSMNNHKDEIMAALKADLGKSEQEAFMCEYGLSLSELTYMEKHIKKYAKNRRATTPLTNFAGISYVKPVPYGTVLVMSPWNYPILLTIEPLIDAIAAGNTVVIKPSAYSENCSRALASVIRDAFSPEYVAVIEGGREANQFLLDQKYDFIFFTGSQSVGREVMKKASNNLTPVALELGGKSPVIIDKSANINLAAKRIVFGKYLNCGQTCVAPDYILVHASVKDAFIDAVKVQIEKQFGKTPLSSDQYGKIINEKHFKRINSLIDKNKVVYGGNSDSNQLKIEPTVMDNVSFEDSVMQEEIFGPIMPVLTFTNIEDVIKDVNSKPHPLALYIFASDKAIIKMVTEKCQYGGGCINDTIVHLACSTMPFGGVGESGMGSYHGAAGFDTFSHHKSIIDKKCWIDLDLRYQPYNKSKFALIKAFLK